MRAVTAPHEKSEKNRYLTDMLESLDAKCRKCAPLNPLECVTNCKVWKLKNELRRLHEAMSNPNFTKDLFNTLKNEKRLRILKAIMRGQCSITQIQQELKKTGCQYSQDTINEEYLSPLLEVGLASETQDRYQATTFGGRLTEMIEGFPEFVNVLPSSSECYEEVLLSALLPGPKTFEAVEAVISPSIVSRTLKRLKTAGLITTSEDRDYIFFFRSKRDSYKETLSPAQKRVYQSIPHSGISAKRLAEKTDLSVRLTYKYLRELKGKKLVFARKTPKVYLLTGKGEKLALMIRYLQNIVEEAWNSSEQIVSKENS
jgi:predicted transcriptional regulator